MNPLEAIIRKLWDRSGARSHAQDLRLRRTDRLVARAEGASRAAHRMSLVLGSYMAANGRLRR